LNIQLHNFNFDAGILTVNNDKKDDSFNTDSKKTAIALNKDRQSVRLYISLKHLRSDSCLD